MKFVTPFITFSRDRISLKITHRCPKSPIFFHLSWQKLVFLADTEMEIAQANSKANPPNFLLLQVWPKPSNLGSSASRCSRYINSLWRHQDPNQITETRSMSSPDHLDSDLFFPASHSRSLKISVFGTSALYFYTYRD